MSHKLNPIEQLRMMEEASEKKKEYDVRFCSCGTIHFIESETVQTAVTANRELIVICGGCGKSFVIGADREPNWENPESSEYAYSMYSNDFNKSFTTTIEESFVIMDDGSNRVFSHNPIVRYSMGKRPMMMTGQRASHYRNGKFYDEDYDVLSLLESCTLVSEVQRHVDHWKLNKSVVNTTRLFNELSDDELRHLSHYSLEGLDWTNTKYETDYNKKK